MKTLTERMLARSTNPRRPSLAALLAASLLVVIAARGASAVVVPVPNFSFESPNGGVGNPDGGPATSWTANGGAGSGGVSYFSFGFPAASQGTQYHWLNLPGFGGPNPSVTRSNPGLIGAAQAGTYTLTVAGGRRNNDATTDGRYVIELLAGSAVIGSQTVNNPFATFAPGTWNDITAVAVINPADSSVGQDLSIRLSAFNGTGGVRSQGQFDNVRLTFDPVPPDYVVTLSSGALTVNDVSGNGETLAITEPAAGSIQFAAAGRVFRVNGGPNLLGSSGILSLAGVTSITVNAGAGGDNLAVGAFAGPVPSLTLSGGTGDDAVTFNGALTLANNANLNVDLQDDDAPVGVDSVKVAAGANVLASGTGTITIRCSRSVSLGSGASLQTVNGALVVEANRQLSGSTSQNSIGVALENALIRANGTGQVTISGRGGNGPDRQGGVRVANGASIVGGTTGTVTVDGIGGVTSGSVPSHGVTFSDGAITSLGADVRVTGRGGEAPNAPTGSIGVIITGAAARVTAGGGGSVTVQGTGGTAPVGSTTGVQTQSSGVITSGGGNVLVTGLGGVSPAAGNFCNGVSVVASSQITAGGSGTVTVQGTGGQSDGSYNTGVTVTQNSLVTSSGGNVSVTGHGGGTALSAGSQFGVLVYLSAQITAGGAGTVTVHGTGGPSAGSQNVGVDVEQSGLVTSSGGNVSVTGQGGGTASAAALQHGVSVFLSAQITAGGAGTVTVQGTGGQSAGNQNLGVGVEQSGLITSSGGAVSVTGVGGGSNPSAAINTGVFTQLNGFITSGGGDVAVTGTPGVGGSAYGIRTSSGSGISTVTSGGNIALNADLMAFLAGSTIGTQATGSATVRPLTNGRPIFLVGPGWIPGSGALVLLDEDLDAIDAGTINIGDANSGFIDVAGPIAHPPSTLLPSGSTRTAARLAVKLGHAGRPTRPSPLLQREESVVAGEAEIAPTLTLASPMMALADAEVPAGEVPPSRVEIAAVPARLALPTAAQAIVSNFKLTSGGDIYLRTSTDRSFDTGGGTLNLKPGPGAAIRPWGRGTDVTASTLTMGSGAKLALRINGTAADSLYDRLSVAGPVNLNGVELATSGSYTPSIGDRFTIVRNGYFATTGTFNGLPEGGYLLNFLGSPLAARITYQGGSAPPSVPNFSFESPNGGVGNPDGGPATGWTANGGAGSGGVSYFSFGFPAASQGSQYHWLNLPGFGGPNPSVTRSNAGLVGTAEVGTYTLTVAGGRRNNDATTDGRYVIELLADTTVIGSQTVNNPFATYSPGTWNDITAVAVVAPGSPAIGRDLSIRLSAFDGTGGIRSQGQFDNVRLSFAPLGPNDDVVLTVVSPTTDTPVAPALPSVSGLSAARPNPFTTAANLTFALAARGNVDLAIYSVDGRRVRLLAHGPHEPGEYHTTWNGTAENDRHAQPGVYFVRLTTPQGTFHRRIVKLD